MRSKSNTYKFVNLYNVNNRYIVAGVHSALEACLKFCENNELVFEKFVKERSVLYTLFDAWKVIKII